MIIQGNALTVLKGFDADSIDCVVTSPPYWSLRKYDIPDVIFDGVEGCEHEWVNKTIIRRTPGDRPSESSCVAKHRPNDTVNRPDFEQDICLKCSAWRGQLGLEPTFELYLKHLLEIFDEVRRVLKPTGTCWVNLGDSYATQGGPVKNEFKKLLGCSDTMIEASEWKQSRSKNRFDVPTKSLCLIPYRFAIAMIDRGWICRNLIIWHKPNCMPSSATDRMTVDFEPCFFFVKSKKYWFEQQYDNYDKPLDRWGGDSKKLTDNLKGDEYSPAHRERDMRPNPQGRNKRCVWDVPTQPYPESHFATFPEALVEPMIRAGCPKDGTVLDPFCGSGTALRVAEKLGRKAIGIDLGYESLAEKRLKNNQMELI